MANNNNQHLKLLPLIIFLFCFNFANAQDKSASPDQYISQGTTTVIVYSPTGSTCTCTYRRTDRGLDQLICNGKLLYFSVSNAPSAPTQTNPYFKQTNLEGTMPE